MPCGRRLTATYLAPVRARRRVADPGALSRHVLMAAAMIALVWLLMTARDGALFAALAI